MTALKYAGIKPNDTVDGIGISVSFWTQGCVHFCQGCHNPDTWDKNGGMNLEPDYISNIINLLRKNGIKRNLSILGGEPLTEYNLPIVYMLVMMVKKELPDTKIFIWSGFTFENLIARNDYITNEILKASDVLVDGKFELENRDITLWLRGSPNQRVIDLQKSFKNNEVVLLTEKE